MGDITVKPVTGIGEVRPGDDLAATLAAAAPWLADGDVLVVTSKVVSKAEGRLVALPPPGPEREAAREAVLAAETERVVARRGATRIVRTHHGFVLAGAGIDASNVDSGVLVLLPVDPDASARRLRDALRDRLGVDVAVVVSDTMGRPWRLGQTDVAVGAAGIGAVRDYRGELDAYGNELSVTQMAVVDELAAAADLVKGKLDQVPAAVVRGFHGKGSGDGARTLLRGGAEDMFALGTAEARLEGLRSAALLADAAAFGPGPLPDGALDRALSTVDLPVAVHETGDGMPDGTAAVLVPRGAPADALAIGAALHRLRAALAAEGLASAWLLDHAPFGVLAVGNP